MRATRVREYSEREIQGRGSWVLAASFLLILSGYESEPAGWSTSARALVPDDPAPVVVTLHPEDQSASFQGWGTSLSWWANVLGGWSSEPLKNEVLDLLFDSGRGLGLTVVRYNIGAGTSPLHKSFRKGAEMPCFYPAAGKWDWSADAKQRLVLAQARQRGANVLEAFVNSPPVWMTKSGSAAGSLDGSTNLKAEYFDPFVDFVAEVLRHFQQDWGTVFQTVTPMNEPSSYAWKADRDREGCHFERAEQNRLLKSLAKALKDRGLKQTSLSAPDESLTGQTIDSYTSYEATIRQSLSQVNTHATDAARRPELFRLAADEGKRLWISEVTEETIPNPASTTLEAMLQLGALITRDLGTLRPNAWVLWQALEDASLPSRLGVLRMPMDGTASYSVTKQYAGMAQYSRFIRPGARFLGTGSDKVIAAHDAARSRLTLVALNDSASPIWYTYDLQGFYLGGATIRAYRSSGTESLSELTAPAISDGNRVSHVAEAMSITTYVIESVVPVAVVTRVRGQAFGTTGSYASSSSTFEKAFDGNSLTFFDSAQSGGAYAGLDLGASNTQVVNRIAFRPRLDQPGRMVGGEFQGSNSSPTTGFTRLHLIERAPATSWNVVDLQNNTAYRYIRYLSPDGGFGNVAEIELHSLPPASAQDSPAIAAP